MSTRNAALNPKQRRAVGLLARGDATHKAVAAEVGVREETMVRWFRQPAFVAAVQVETEAIADGVRKQGIAHRQNRVNALNSRHQLMQSVIVQRARAMQDDAPGSNTGLLVRQTRQLGVGKDAQIVVEYTFDAALVRELREHERQTAIEVGEWQENRDSDLLKYVNLGTLHDVQLEQLSNGVPLLQVLLSGRGAA